MCLRVPAAFSFFLLPDRDTLTDPEGSADFIAAASSKDKQLVAANDAWHAVAMEPGNEKYRAMVIEWILARA